MEIIIDTSRLDTFLSLPPGQMLWEFFLNFGFIVLGILYLIGYFYFYLFYKQNKWVKENVRYLLLAIDIPKGNEQSPKATENMFAYLSGAHGSQNFFEKWFEGKFQLSFSYEIVSLEGYTQFIIRTPIRFRNLIESSVYSQYPDAEITEVEDYVQLVPNKFPDEEYDAWGSEFMFTDHWAYPIKVYSEFEYPSGPSETQFKDPMAALMDLNSSLGLGEYFWFQIIITPTGINWIKESDQMAEKVIGRKPKTKKDIADYLMEGISEASEIVFELWRDIEDKPKEEREPSLIDLTPKQKKQLEGIQNKASKVAFEAKLRAVYIAKKDVMNTSKVANGFVGYMKQFTALDLNSFMPDIKYTLTKTAYFSKDTRLINRKNLIVRNYVNRDSFAGRLPGIYNIEELATLWHFPIEASVRAPMIQKAPGRKADAPSDLPLSPDFEPVSINDFVFDENDQEVSNNLDKEKSDLEKSLPKNLPFAD
jgi:hypothetical protein